MTNLPTADEQLTALRGMARWIISAYPTNPIRSSTALALAETFETLDTALTDGAELPTPWRSVGYAGDGSERDDELRSQVSTLGDPWPGVPDSQVPRIPHPDED